MYSQVKKYINDRMPFPDDDLEKALLFSDVQYFKKGDYILRSGEQCRFIGFLNYGLIVSTLIDETGKEIPCGFTKNDCFFTYTEGLINNSPSHKDFIALEDCEMLMLQKDKLPLIFSLNPKFETLFTKMLADDLRIALLAEQNIRILSVEKRYLHFIEAFPDVFNRLPLKYIAGYLGIEPPSLSRLRKRLMKG